MNWFKSYLSNRSQKTKCDGSYFSTLDPVTIGVPQCSTLGPLLFISYVNDLCHIRDLFDVILLPAGTSIDLPVGYMDQPTGLLHIYLWRRLCGRQGKEVFQITASGGYLDNLLGRLCEFRIFENYCTHSFQPVI